MTDLTPADAHAIRDGAAAHAALETVGPLFQAVRDAALERWRTSSSGQTDLREKLWQTVTICGQVETMLKDMVAASLYAQDFNEAVEARNVLAKQGLTRP